VTTTQHLQLIAAHWADLHALRTSRPHDAWPPPSLNHYLRSLEEYDPADRNAPVRLHVIDTITIVQTVLVDLADQTAAQIQRPAMSHAPADWPQADRARRDQLADQDAADPRRWRYIGQRTAVEAAHWLAARLNDQPGPFTPLTGAQRHHIAGIAATAAQRVEHALGLARRAAPLKQACACGGTLLLEGGDGRPPSIHCEACGRAFQSADTAA
jgi:hypothetical protein